MTHKQFCKSDNNKRRPSKTTVLVCVLYYNVMNRIDEFAGAVNAVNANITNGQTNR